MAKSEEFECLVEAIQLALNRFEKDHASEYMARRNEDEYYANILEGMYFTLDSIKNSLVGYYGDEAMSETLGLSQLSDKIEKAVFGKKK